METQPTADGIAGASDARAAAARPRPTLPAPALPTPSVNSQPSPFPKPPPLPKPLNPRDLHPARPNAYSSSIAHSTSSCGRSRANRLASLRTETHAGVRTDTLSTGPASRRPNSRASPAPTTPTDLASSHQHKPARVQIPIHSLRGLWILPVGFSAGALPLPLRGRRKRKKKEDGAPMTFAPFAYVAQYQDADGGDHLIPGLPVDLRSLTCRPGTNCAPSKLQSTQVTKFRSRPKFATTVLF